MYPDYYQVRAENKAQIKRLGLLAGGALLGYIIIQNGLSLLFTKVGLMDLYSRNPVYQSAMDIIFTLCGLFLPFLFFGRKMQKISHCADPLRPKAAGNKTDVFLAVVAGVGVCMLANIFTSYFTMFLAMFGIELSSPDIAMPGGAEGVLITLLRVVVVAALCEEIAMRGYVMGSLRKYGDGFAIFAAAFVFAVMHGNLIQAPFALIAGVAIGYFTVKTGTLWTAFIIHALNNTVSVLSSYAYDMLGAEKASVLYMIILVFLITAGLICFAAFTVRTKSVKLSAGNSMLSPGEKMWAFIFNPTMIIALVFMLYITAAYIDLA